MTVAEQAATAKQFVKDWTGKGDEKQDTQRFWMALLQKVYGVAEPDKFIEFELRVKLENTSFIDAYIKDTHVLIEQKGIDIDLRKGYKQSDGSTLTPYGQARRYAGYLPHNQNPRWIVVCNFKEFHIHDMNRPNESPEVLMLEDLEKEYPRLQFLVDTGSDRIHKEMQISLQAGELVGKLYDALLKQYNSPASDTELKSLNMLCVRLVFCLYAEDAGIFGGHDMFRRYLQSFQPKNVRKGLIDLFKVLDTKPEDRDPYMDDDLAAFPYVNGGLFADENIIVPKFTDEIINLLVNDCSDNFNWSEISPTIFGAVFESTLNPETRRAGGMHYTSIENIHKVIDPLFYSALCQELEEISVVPVEKTRKHKLEVFQEKLAKLRFLDPACGSGNFLTETYISLRRLENKVIGMLSGIGKGAVEGQIMMGMGNVNPIQVSISQFYGIEINDFAVTVAKTALWIAESQMMKATEELVHMNLDFLPLKSYANITEGNALRVDWDTVIPRTELSYIMGNPPFLGKNEQEEAQKEDLSLVFGAKFKGLRNIDYVSGWYRKAADYINGTSIRCAFVSTNSITQGEQVPLLWKPIFEQGVHFDFAYRTFRWDSEAKIKAHVHCVIIGFSVAPNPKPRILFLSDKLTKDVTNINAYLVEGPSIFVESRKKSICDVPKMVFGSMPNDGGHLSDYSQEERDTIVAQYPDAADMFRPFIGAAEYLRGKKRYCLWLGDIQPSRIKRIPPIADAVTACRELRASSNRGATNKLAATPYLFGEIRQPDCEYIVVPRHSSQNRKYLPMGYMDKDTICGDANMLIPNTSLYHLGILLSNVHMSWMRAVCGRIKSDYRYSAEVVYNNFPWPTPTPEQIKRIEESARRILDARAMYPQYTLDDLYDDNFMKPELIAAHRMNDKAVMQAYGFWGKLNTPEECVAELMKMYQTLTK